ncbi:Uncharacterized conserved protein, DUF924 family [Rhizobium sp. RU20A]|uniref:DUF924 family protein n=1 Tax=Rhizobium sp. RU20A TaxID=1907412 RepID=UPI0009553EE2|nr:DUF924 family protein [Rhizobium sp. RU20A]SIQ16984.1 Uncharacterized conserved protein, DUF924 family [Rhizobium sp. RU20A]
MTDRICAPEEILGFWFEELTPEQWFKPTPALDAQCERRFAATHLHVARGVPDSWRGTPDRHLATIILLDQLPRNIYRGTALAFATDGLALAEARALVKTGDHLAIAADRRAFAYLPFEHSENLNDQETAVALFSELGTPLYLDYAIRHAEVIRAFGRFPHRNAVLGRTSTDAEIAYLAQPGAGF